MKSCIIFRVAGVIDYLQLRTARNKFKFGCNYYGQIAFNKWMSRSAISQILGFNKFFTIPYFHPWYTIQLNYN